MKKNKQALGQILQAITKQPKINLKDAPKTCYEIVKTAENVGYHFTYMNNQVYLFQGQYYAPVDDATLKVFIKFALIYLSDNTVAASDRKVINDNHAQFPYSVMTLDTAPPASKINFDNGTLDLVTMKFSNHSYKDYFPYVLPYGYDPNAACPVFEKFLSEVLPERQVQDVIAEYIAWLFTPSLKLEKVMLLYGKGCNGKSVLVEIIENLIGQENVSHESLSDLADNANARANIIGKRLNTCTDIGTAIENPDVLKRLASGESISVKKLYQDVATVDDYAKNIFCCNELPKSKDMSDGFVRRLLIIPFDRQIPKDRVDPTLASRIISNELPGIMNWVIDGYQRLARQQAFTDSPCIQRMTEEYRRHKTVKGKIKLYLPPFWK